MYSKGQNKPEAVKKPLARSVELVEANIKVNFPGLFIRFLKLVDHLTHDAILLVLVRAGSRDRNERAAGPAGGPASALRAGCE